MVCLSHIPPTRWRQPLVLACSNMKDCRTKELAVAFGVLLTFTLLAVWLSYSQASFLFILKPHLEDKKVRGNWSIDGSPLLLNMYSKATAFINNTKILIPSNDTKHSNLTDITYERTFLPGKDSLDVFISVRTSQSLHKSRLKLLLHTWLQTVDPKQVRLYQLWLRQSAIEWKPCSVSRSRLIQMVQMTVTSMQPKQQVC